MILRILLLAVELILLFVFYWIFELQNGWPHNENVFQEIQIVTAIGIASTFALSLHPASRISSPFPLFIAFVIVMLISRSDLNFFTILVNLAIIMSLFLIALIMRKLDHRTNTSFGGNPGGTKPDRPGLS
jgi:hypothetical protein